MSRPDVIVAGGGIVGAAIAYQLARRSDLSVLVADKGSGPGEGSTGASSAICRQRYSHPQVIRLARHGQQAYHDWSAFTGLTEPRSGLVVTGVAWLMDWSPDYVADEVDRIAAAGGVAASIGPEELTERYPAITACTEPVDMDRPDQHECRPGEAFLFEPTSGYADPTGALADLLDAARREGVEVRFGAPVTGVLREGGRAVGVELAGSERVEAGLVINAAGPWCNHLNRLAGVEPRWTLVPTRIQTIYRSWPPELGALPTAADATTGIYFRPQGTDQVVIGSVLEEDEREVIADPDDYRREPDPAFVELKLAGLHHRIPDLEPKGRVSGICGPYTVTAEDVHPIVGPSEVDGFWFANGFSGHGFKLAPMVGAMIARELTGEEAAFDTDVPMSLFSPDRDPISVQAKNVLA